MKARESELLYLRDRLAAFRARRMPLPAGTGASMLLGGTFLLERDGLRPLLKELRRREDTSSRSCQQHGHR
jgi:hypothetical protein